jgi:DHA1 family bicyclomycin/chloramphenicol resistance-like MFS transporter/DHA1 family 2-module integral membrane pump EmrD-like MFS transporter
MQIVYGPLSDAYGRKKPLMVGLIIMLFGTYMCFIANQDYELLLGRALQGLGAASCNAIYKAALRDLFPSKVLTKVSSYFAIITTIAIAIAPFLGGIIDTEFGWRWNFGAIFILNVILLIMVFLTKETNRYKDSKQVSYASLKENILLIFRNRNFVVATTAILLSYGGLLCWLSVSPFLLINIFQFNSIQCGFINLMVGFAFAVGGAMNSLIATKENSNIIIKFGFGIMLFAGLFLFMTGFYNVSPLVVISAVICFSFGTSFVAPNAMAICLEPFKRIAGLAGAVLGLIKNVGAALICNILAFAPDTNQMPLSIAYICISIVGLTMVFRYLTTDNKAKA